MPKFYITHVEPLNQLKGKEALFFIREVGDGKNRSHVVIKQIPHYFFTRNLPNEQIIPIYRGMEDEARMQNEGNLKELKIYPQPYNRERSFIQVEGSKEDKVILPKEFVRRNHSHDYKGDPVGLNSPTKLLRWYYPPFMKIKSLDEIQEDPKRISHRSYMDVEDIVKENYAVIDIEVEGWQKGKDRIFMAVYASPTNRIIFHDLPFEREEQNGFKLERFDSQKEFGEKLSNLLQEEDPLFIYGHNIMGFDQLRIRDLTKAYNPSTNKHYPVTKSAQGLGRVLTKGRWTIDTFTYHFYNRNLLSNVKLETIANIKKSIDYQEQADLVVKARKGDKKAFEILTKYCIEDGLYAEQAGEEIKRIVIEKARLFRTTPDRICSTSRLVVADEYWKRRYFIIRKQYRDIWRKRRKEKQFSLDELCRRVLPSTYKRGVFDDVHVLYLAPFVAAGRKIMKSRSPDLVNKFLNANRGLEKFDALQTMHSQLSHLAEEASRINKSDRNDRWKEKALKSLFWSRGVNKEQGLEFANNMSRVLRQANIALQQYQIINRGPQLYFIKGDVDHEKMEEKLFGCYLGKGKTLSLGKGKVIANPFHERNPKRFVYQGLKVDKGKKTNFEKKIMNEIIKRIFAHEPLKRIKKNINKQLEEYYAGKCSPEDYYVSVNHRTYTKNILEDVLRNVNRPVHASFMDMKNKIGNRLSKQTIKELSEIVERCEHHYSYPAIVELVEEIIKPIPPKIDLVYGPTDFSTKKILLLPKNEVRALDFDEYRRKAEETLAQFLKILK